MIRQPPCQFAERIAVAENAGQRCKIVKRAWRTDLHRETPARLVVASHRADRLADVCKRAIL